jgi:hypothetical protein
MFEKSPCDMVASVYIHERDFKDAYANGIELWTGYRTITYDEAKKAILKMVRLRQSVPQHLLRRHDSLTNQLRNAFGPDLWADTESRE